MASNAQLTPMMAQYRRIKSELPKDALLLFRLGDFYEMFFEDAQAGAQLLNVALTKRGVVPMCGIPFHAANAYIGRLLKAGRKVAICDQMEDARPGQLVKREVTQILSPGTHFDERMLKAERNNFLAAVYPAGKTFGLAFTDLTTGDFMTTEVEGDAEMLTELQRLRPAELIYPAEAGAVRDLLRGGSRRPEAERQPLTPALSPPAATARQRGEPDGERGAGKPRGEEGVRHDSSAATGYGWILNGYDDWVFAPETALFTVREHFKVASLDGFGLRDRTAAIGAAGAVLHYLTQHLRRDVANLTRISFYQRSDYLALDFTTLRHLEILEPLASRRAAERFALRRAEPHGHTDGRAATARLAFATPGHSGADLAKAGSGADVRGECRRLGGAPRAARAGAGPGTNARPAERGEWECAGFSRAAERAGADSAAQADCAGIRGDGRTEGRARCGIGSEPAGVGYCGRGGSASVPASSNISGRWGSRGRSPSLAGGIGGAGD